MLQVKIADFWFTTLSSLPTFARMAAETNCRWAAPEVIKNNACDTKSDVFSFGILVWELLTRFQPYFDIPEWQVGHVHVFECDDFCTRED